MGGVRKFKRNKRPKNQERKPYVEIVRENQDFFKYYKAQNLVEESEWDSLISALQSDLPATFRISTSDPKESARLRELICGFLESCAASEALRWFPGDAWQMTLSRKDIRRVEANWRLHQFLISETAIGAISRQETVSMLPPLILDLGDATRVLDMCAAPGSKTTQILESLNPNSCLVANDIDNSRCYMLVHQAKRLNLPNLLITNHDATILPNFRDSKGVVSFDRILADVPCTGDGTLRKNPDIWTKWNCVNGNNLHGVQYRVLKRAAELVQESGKIVYSTCSLNPIECEAVVARVLREASGALVLDDVSGLIPGLATRPGLTTWKVAAKDVQWIAAPDQIPEVWATVVRPSMFPPAEPGDPFNLKRCVRILPHDQNTGGFFMARLTRVGPLPWTKAAPPADNSSSAPPPPAKKPRFFGYREDPFVFFTPEEPVFALIRDFYGLEGLSPDCLLTRCKVGKINNIYFVNKSIKSLIEENQESVKIINSGVKVFSRNDSRTECSFRLVQEGLHAILQFLTGKRRISVSESEFVSLLYHFDPKNPLDLEQLESSTRDQLATLSAGSCVIDCSTSELSVSVVGWKGAKTFRVYIGQPEAIHYLRLFRQDTSMFDVNKFKKDEEQEKEKEDIDEEESSEKTCDLQENKE